MHRLYTLAIYLTTPLVLLYFLIRGFRDAGYMRRWPERFGFYSANTPGRATSIVVHAASVGEVAAAAPLVKALLKTHTNRKVVVTTLTPTGSRRVMSLFGERVEHCYVPLELPGAVGRFFRTHSPALLLVMETEIWPQLFRAAGRHGVPLMLVNARLSRKSLAAYRRFGRWVGSHVKLADHIAAQSKDDAGRFIELGASAEKISVTGNLKFDAGIDSAIVEAGSAMRAAWGSVRPVVVAGSTRGNEHGIIASAWGKVLEVYPEALLVIAPRHPERFIHSFEEARKAGLSPRRFSDGPDCVGRTNCLVIDAMGELVKCYAAGDVAFVGGTLTDIGGHNVLEPAALGKPILLGPSTYNLGEIADQLIAAGGAIEVADGPAFAEAVIELLGSPERRDEMGQAALRTVESGRGAVDRTMVQIAAVAAAQRITQAAG